MVDEAKAFCPGCGSSFVDEEEREDDSEFEASGGTMEFSQSVFNVMLSDMGLNISEIPDARQQPAEVKAADTTPADDAQKNAAPGNKVPIALIFGILLLVVIAILLAVFLIRK
mgnify:FL=1